MNELRFSEAKDAISRSKSVEAIREARGTVENLGGTYHTPFEFPVATELLEAYLRRRELPYTAHKSARVYLAADGKVTYDDLAVETGSEPTHVFGISAASKDAETKGLQTPPFREIVADARLEQPSVTNIIHVDTAGLVVFKAFLKTTLGALAREGTPRPEAQSAEEKAISEVKQLELLSQIFRDNATVYSPRVLGRNGAVVAMEYIQGEDMAAMTLRKALKRENFIEVADVLALLHEELAKKADYIREEFKIPEWHTANSVVCLEKKAAHLREKDWNKDLPPAIFSRFTSLAEKASALVAEHHYDDFPDVIHGDFKDENMIAMPDGRIAVLDPALCAGRKSMDIAKFGRSILFKDAQAYREHFPDFLRRYQEKAGGAVDEREIAHMVGIDMLNIMRGYLLLPERLVSQFPPGVKNVRKHIDFYLSAIESVLGGTLKIPSAP